MDFDYSPKVSALIDRQRTFVSQQVLPAEADYFAALHEGPSRWVVPPVIEELKTQAKSAGLWNRFLPESEYENGTCPLTGLGTDTYNGALLTTLRH